MTTESKLSIKTTNSIRLVLVSDTHELHRELDVPDGDILIHCGDLSMMSRSLAAIEDFNDWLGDLPHKMKLLVQVIMNMYSKILLGEDSLTTRRCSSTKVSR